MRLKLHYGANKNELTLVDTDKRGKEQVYVVDRSSLTPEANADLTRLAIHHVFPNEKLPTK